MKIILFGLLFATILISISLFTCTAEDDATIVQRPTSNTHYIDNNWYFNNVYVMDDNNAYIVGSDSGKSEGIIYKYIDGTWSKDITISSSCKTWKLEGIAFSGDENGYVCGYGIKSGDIYYNGVILTNLFNSWDEYNTQDVISPEDWKLNGIDFFTPTNGIAVGFHFQGYGIIIKYEGNTWSEVLFNAGETTELKNVSILSESVGYIVGVEYGEEMAQQKGKLIRNLSGFWVEQTITLPGDNNELNDVHVFSENKAIAVGTDLTNQKAILLEYNGTNWAINDNLPSGGSSYNLCGCFILSDSITYAVGSRCDAYQMCTGVILYNDSTGWVELTLPEFDGDWELKQIHFCTSGKGFAVGTDKSGGNGNYKGIIIEVSGVSTYRHYVE